MSYILPRGRTAATATIGLLIAATGLTACSSSAKTGGGSTTPTPSSAASSGSASASLLGPDKAATGTPVKIGYAYGGVSAAIDGSVQLPAAQAIVKYANEKLGGVGGHPITLDPCADKTDASTGQDCGNQFVKDGVIAVAAGADGVASSVVKPLTAAGIAYFDSNNTALNANNVFILTNTAASYSIGAVAAKAAGAKAAALVVIDVPQASGPFKMLTPPFYKAAGVTEQVITVPIGTADMTPQIASTQSNNPGVYELIGNAPFCAAAIKAIKTLGSKAEIIGIPNCLDKTTAASIPGGYAGMKVLTNSDLDPADSEYKLYEAWHAAYASSLLDDSDVQNTFQGLLGEIRASNAGGFTGTTPAAALTAIRTATNVKIPLGGGASFACDGKAVPSVDPEICSTVSFLADAKADGTGSTGYKVFDDPSVFTAPK